MGKRLSITDVSPSILTSEHLAPDLEEDLDGAWHLSVNGVEQLRLTIEISDVVGDVHYETSRQEGNPLDTVSVTVGAEFASIEWNVIIQIRAEDDIIVQFSGLQA